MQLKSGYDKFKRVLDTRDMIYPYELVVPPTNDATHFNEWLHAHCTGKYRVFIGRHKFFVGFEHEHDMIAFELTWL